MCADPLSTFDKGLELEKGARFDQAKSLYQDLLLHTDDETLLEKVRQRLADMDDLIAEKAVYQRIDENARMVLTEIGLDIAENQALMDLLLEADAIDFANETALFIPLQRSYIEHCLEQVPRALPQDPGPNTFGTGSTSPFLKRAGEDELRPASRAEYERIIRLVADNRDVVNIFSLPVGCDKSTSFYELARLMEKEYQGLKMIPTNTMTDDEAAFLQGKEDWLDGTSLIANLAPMSSMVEPFLRSARLGNNLLLIDQTIAGATGAGSPESFLTQIHAQELFMMILAQTVNPGVVCVHGGIPSVTGTGGHISYSSPGQTFINAAMARVNTWVTGFPSAQTGGSTSLEEHTPEAVAESEASRNALRRYGVHILRHALGALGSLTFFSMEKFLADCERERQARKIFEERREDCGTVPLYFPGDDQALAGIREIAERGNPKTAEHTLRNVDSFRQWEKTIGEAGERKRRGLQASAS